MRTSVKIDFSLLSEERQKQLYQSLVGLDRTFSFLEEKANEAFTLLEEVCEELEEEHGEEHALVELFCSLKAHVEGIVSTFDATENCNKEEKEAFELWWEKMAGVHFK